MRPILKPWGSTDLRPWSTSGHAGAVIGELWFERTSRTAPEAALLLKLLFANEALSIQVHPDDTFARSIGLPHGKTEAWYILSATPDAVIAVGLKYPVLAAELRRAIEDGSIAELVNWRPVMKGDVVFVPAGTIHALGAGLVVAEIQQSSDVTFRLFDYGRQRELHVENAVAVAHAAPPDPQVIAKRLTDRRTLLVACPYFVLERIELPPDTRCEIDVTEETWLLVLEGAGRVGRMNAAVGDAFFLEADHAAIVTGSVGLTCLVAYAAAAPLPDLLSVHSSTQLMEARS